MDAVQLKELSEALDSVWASLMPVAEPAEEDAFPPAGAQEFVAVITTIARNRNDGDLWAMIGRWAGEKA